MYAKKYKLSQRGNGTVPSQNMFLLVETCRRVEGKNLWKPAWTQRWAANSEYLLQPADSHMELGNCLWRCFSSLLVTGTAYAEKTALFVQIYLQVRSNWKLNMNYFPPEIISEIRYVCVQLLNITFQYQMTHLWDLKQGWTSLVEKNSKWGYINLI